MPKPSHRNKILAYQCAKCFTTDALKLAWFYGSQSVFSDCLLCNKCFKESFNQLTQETVKAFLVDSKKSNFKI